MVDDGFVVDLRSRIVGGTVLDWGWRKKTGSAQRGYTILATN